jgi:cell division protein FtsN
MANYERGYEQSDDVRVYDGAEDEDDEEGSRLPILIVMALLVLAAFGGVVWLAYERGVASGRTEPRIITAEQGPVKVAPPASANASDNPYKGLKIYEQPAPSDEEAGTAATNTTSASTAPPALKPATTMAAAPAAAMAALPTATAPKPAAAKPAPVQMATASSPAPTAAKPVPVTTAKPVAPATAKPVPPVDLRVATASNASSAAPPAQAKPTAPAASDASTNPAPAGAYLLQIGAYKSQEEADSSWKAFAAKHAALLAGFSPNVKQVDLADKGTWYRLRIGAFADKDAASALCERLKADGGNCFLAK